jgi:hypothetical protein
MRFDKTLLSLSVVLSTIFLYFTLSASAAPIPSGGYKTLIKIIALPVVVKRHSSQRGREKKIELHFTHIHFEKEQQKRQSQDVR